MTTTTLARRALVPAVALVLGGCSGTGSVPTPSAGAGLQSSSVRSSTAGPFSKASPQTVKPTETVLYSFTGNPDGQYPDSTLVEDAAGNFYGTTEYGGINGNGSVFKLTPAGSGTYTESVLWSFSYYTDGGDPQGVIVDSSGALYGVTLDGAANDLGAVFKLTPGPSGYTESILHTFQGNNDGEYPSGTLAIDSAGDLYGTTMSGGLDTAGTVYELANSGSAYTYSQIYFFQSYPDGASPQAGLLLTSSGALIGSASSGGKNNDGAIFQLTPAGSGSYTERLLYSFNGPKKDLGNPYSAIVADASGNLYGSGYDGGAKYRGGVFKLTPSGGGYKESVLYSFTTSRKNGYFPQSSLLLDQSGNIYGTTHSGGIDNVGIIFELSPTGKKNYKETVLESFENQFGGGYPLGGLIQDATGALYGTASRGGSEGAGIVYKLTL